MDWKLNFQLLLRALFFLSFTVVFGLEDTFSVKSDSAEVPVLPLSNSQGFYDKKYNYNKTYNYNKKPAYSVKKPAYSNSYRKLSNNDGNAGKKPSYGGDTVKNYDYSKQAAGNGQYKSGAGQQQYGDQSAAAYGGYNNDYDKDKSRPAYNYGDANKNGYDGHNEGGYDYKKPIYHYDDNNDNHKNEKESSGSSSSRKSSSSSSKSSSSEEYGNEKHGEDPYNPEGPMPPYPPYKVPPYYPPYYYPTPAPHKTSTKSTSTVFTPSSTAVQTSEASSSTTTLTTSTIAESSTTQTLTTSTTAATTTQPLTTSTTAATTTQPLTTSTTAATTTQTMTTPITESTTATQSTSPPTTAAAETSTPTSTESGGGGPGTQGASTVTVTQSVTDLSPTVTPTVPTPPVTDVTVSSTPSTTENQGGGPGTQVTGVTVTNAPSTTEDQGGGPGTQVTGITVTVTPSTTEDQGGGPAQVTESPSSCTSCTKDQLRLEAGDGDKVPDPFCGNPQPTPDGCTFVKLKCETDQSIDGSKMNICFNNASSNECCVESKNAPFNSVEELLNCTGTSVPNRPVWVLNSGTCKVFNASEVSCAINSIATTTEENGKNPGTSVTTAPKICANCVKDELTLVQGDRDKVPDPILDDTQIGPDGCTFTKVTCETRKTEGAKMNICIRNESKECCIESNKGPFNHSDALLNCSGTANEPNWVLNGATCNVIDVAEIQCKVNKINVEDQAKASNNANVKKRLDAMQIQTPKKARSSSAQGIEPSLDKKQSSPVRQIDPNGEISAVKNAASADQIPDKSAGQIPDKESGEKNAASADQIPDKASAARNAASADQIPDKASAAKNAASVDQITDKASVARNAASVDQIPDKASAARNAASVDQIPDKASAARNAASVDQIPDNDKAPGVKNVMSNSVFADEPNKTLSVQAATDEKNAAGGNKTKSAENNAMSSAANDESLASDEEDNAVPNSSDEKSVPKAGDNTKKSASPNGKSAPVVRNNSGNNLASPPNGTATASKNLLA